MFQMIRKLFARTPAKPVDIAVAYAIGQRDASRGRPFNPFTGKDETAARGWLFGYMDGTA